MKRAVVSSIFAAAFLLAAACSHRTDLSQPATQDDFGVQMAKMSLWREALFRFDRTVQLNPADAQAHNNLAVAYEANGDFEKARAEYVEALKLDKSNSYIQKNYSRFVEFMSKNKKRQATKGAIPPADSTGGSSASKNPPAPAPTPIPPSAPPKPMAPPPGPGAPAPTPGMPVPPTSPTPTPPVTTPPNTSTSPDHASPDHASPGDAR